MKFAVLLVFAKLCYEIVCYGCRMSRYITLYKRLQETLRIIVNHQRDSLMDCGHARSSRMAPSHRSYNHDYVLNMQWAMDLPRRRGQRFTPRVIQPKEAWSTRQVLAVFLSPSQRTLCFRLQNAVSDDIYIYICALGFLSGFPWSLCYKWVLVCFLLTQRQDKGLLQIACHRIPELSSAFCWRFCLHSSLSELTFAPISQKIWIRLRHGFLLSCFPLSIDKIYGTRYLLQGHLHIKFAPPFPAGILRNRE